MFASKRLGQYLYIILVHHKTWPIGGQHLCADVMRFENCRKLAGHRDLLNRGRLEPAHRCVMSVWPPRPSDPIRKWKVVSEPGGDFIEPLLIPIGKMTDTWKAFGSLEDPGLNTGVGMPRSDYES